MHYYQASDSELTSVAVAYYWLISIFPCFWWWSISSPIFRFCRRILGFSLPPSLYEGVEKIAREVLTQPSTGLLSFLFISVMDFQNLNFLQKLFNKAYGVERVVDLFPSDAKVSSQFIAAPLCVCHILMLIWSDDFWLYLLIGQRWHYLSGFTRVVGPLICPPLCYLGHALLFSSQSI